MRIRETILIFLLSFPTLSFGQIENRWQPDSVYAKHAIKRILVYLNSPKDLSEIVEFDKARRKVRSVKYSASYNRRTRKNKAVEKIKLYNYDSLDRLINIKDSLGTDSIIYRFGPDGRLISSRKNLGNFIYHTEYFYNPFKTTTTQMRDSIVVYEKTKEYEKSFYVKKTSGYNYEPKLKKDSFLINGEINIASFKDYQDLERFENEKILKNIFKHNGQLINSEVKSVFMNDRINEYELHYNY
ncbi:hypothetical protein [Marivirga sericea]|uniref:hypothetical protein n=1 Tax=Marivirga sericea TaxID=1028 RepID=UPI000A1CB94C|nr:hypothetical protein [Marivirga sericea]